MDSFSRGAMTFEVADSGPHDGEAVILLHGFPEDRTCWDATREALNAAGYRTLAPDQRGYSPAARPSGRAAYRMSELVGDVGALADAAKARKFHVVGHDWGGAVAWASAILMPDRIHTLTSLSTPHPAAFERAMWTKGQLFKSWYMFLFQVPAIPEWLQLAFDARGFRWFLLQSGLDAATAERYTRRMQEPGALTAALNWYRALVRPGRGSGFPAVGVPTMYVWSTGDVALGRAAAELTTRFVGGSYRFEVLEGVSHWIPEQATDRIVPLLLEHLRPRTDGEESRSS